MKAEIIFEDNQEKVESYTLSDVFEADRRARALVLELSAEI